MMLRNLGGAGPRAIGKPLMRLLALTNLYPNPYQPHRATFNRQQIRALAALHEVHVITPILWTDELRERRRQGPRLATNRRATCDGLTVEHPRYIYPPKLLRSWYGGCFFRSVQATFDRVVREFHPDLVFTPWAYPDGWAAVELCRRAGLPVVVKVHGSDILTLSHYPGRVRRTLETLSRADCIVAVSQHLAQRMIDLGTDSQRLRIVYNGIDNEVFTPGDRQQARAALGLDPATPVVLLVGNFVPVKGLDVLLDACALLVRDGLRFQCHLVGDGPLRTKLQKQVERLGLVERVVCQGSRPHQELPNWYRSADVVALTSHSEGVPNVLLEATACGTPYVASAVGGVPEIAHWGISQLVPPGDPRRLAIALREGLEGRMSGRRNQSFTRSFADAAGELSQLFEGIIAGRDDEYKSCRVARVTECVERLNSPGQPGRVRGVSTRGRRAARPVEVASHRADVSSAK